MPKTPAKPEDLAVRPRPDGEDFTVKDARLCAASRAASPPLRLRLALGPEPLELELAGAKPPQHIVITPLQHTKLPKFAIAVNK